MRTNKAGGDILVISALGGVIILGSGAREKYVALQRARKHPSDQEIVSAAVEFNSNGAPYFREEVRGGKRTFIVTEGDDVAMLASYPQVMADLQRQLDLPGSHSQGSHQET